MELWWEHFLSFLKYFIATILVVAGIATIIMPIAATPGPLGFLIQSRVFLVIAGSLCISSGLTLFIGKLRRSYRWVGIGLMACFMCFLFAGIFNVLVLGTLAFGVWGPNILIACILAILHLRWKFKKEYINPNHFVRDLGDLLKR